MKSVLLKLSGEALAGDKHTGFDEGTVRDVALQVKKVCDSGVRIGIVTGGGNFWRGRSSDSIERTKADQIGMLATVMNCVYVSEVFRSIGLKTKVFTPYAMGDITLVYSKDAVMDALDQGYVVFFAGGTGHPYFSTDTATVLRAIEMEADAIYLAKSIDGVYDSDPAKNSDARKYDEIPISRVIDERLGVIDLAASVLAFENKMPMYVFGLNEKDGITESIIGSFTGTVISVD